MKQIGNLVRAAAQSVYAPSATSLERQSPSESPLARDLIARLGADADLKVIYPANEQSSAARDVTRSIMGGSPSLRVAELAYGRGKVKGWMIAQIAYLNEVTGPEKALSPLQVKDLAESICAEYYYLTFTEIMLFFHWFKLGRYGTFYGSVDPLKITHALRQFRSETAEMKSIEEARIRNERTQREISEGITREEYLQLVERAKDGDEEAKRILNQK